MAVFHSKYRELSFYVDGKLYSFSSGSFSTDDEKVIAVLETITDVKRVDEPESETKQNDTTKNKTEDSPSPKRKSSGK